MARPTTGSVTEHVGRDGRTYRSLRFTAYNKRRRVPLGPVSADEAERALSHAIADVERGTWRPPEVDDTPREAEPVPSFHEFAEEWWTLTKAQLAPSTQADYWWRLTVHLVPYFGETRLDGITFATIERYIAGKRAGLIYDKGKEIGKEPRSRRGRST
jgi:Phage integrase, N-terminal SAM-like domain